MLSEVRIIPARAGFTRSGRPPMSRRMDHPRSRGVYISTRGRMRSPPWIIPARAGFTAASQPSIPSRSDHPRSRGVYDSCPAVDCRTGGSSPLARGLPGYSFRGARERRIIPARAGFTGRRPRYHGGGPDHPRSRGVYDRECLPGARGHGSSPLARGLRRRRVPIQRVLMDHPRSRGVYPRGLRWCAAVRGSSPLARGLRDDFCGRLADLRIIPARAGFTGRPDILHGAEPDHPRSRGVYVLGPVPICSWIGSSPLARGLLLARLAGRTRTKDHPRSRGVYC